MSTDAKELVERVVEAAREFESYLAKINTPEKQRIIFQVPDDDYEGVALAGFCERLNKLSLAIRSLDRSQFDETAAPSSLEAFIASQQPMDADMARAARQASAQVIEDAAAPAQETGTPRTLTDIHFHEGGTHITNFDEPQRSIYVEAVRRFGDDRFVVSDKPTHHMGSEPGGALHWIGELPASDFGPFWRVFDLVRELTAARADKMQWVDEAAKARDMLVIQKELTTGAMDRYAAQIKDTESAESRLREAQKALYDATCFIDPGSIKGGEFALRHKTAIDAALTQSGEKKRTPGEVA